MTLREVDMDYEDINENVNGTGVAGDQPGPPDAATETEELRRRIVALQGDADSRVRAGLHEHPFLALGAAVAAGFLLGRAIRRL
jgi:hypothetical protein